MGIPADSAAGRLILAALAAGQARDVTPAARVEPAAGKPARPKRDPAALVEPGYRCGSGWVEWTVPLRLDPTTNNGSFKKWTLGVAGKHRREVARALAGRLLKLAWLRKVIDDGGRLACTLTRLGGGAMDDDNLPPAGKWVRDTVALFLGQDDGPAGPIDWHYRQAPGGAWGVRVRLERA